MRILIACEESQEVCKAFRNKGHEAFSCDIQPCSGGHPEWHIQKDVTEVLEWGWDMLIAHPPCTFISNAGSRWLFPNGVLNEDRFKKGIEAKKFFMMFFNSNIEKICIENPTPSKIFELPLHTQVIQPYMFGHPYKKRTLLWLKNLPELQPTNNVDAPSYLSFTNVIARGSKKRSKTFEGVAKAMSEQWG